MNATLVTIAAFGTPLNEPAMMVLFGAALLTLATWVRRLTAR